MADREHDPTPNLPPRILGKKKRTSAPKHSLPWYRHTAWAIPLAACVVFAVLIAGGLAVRQLIIVLRTPEKAAPVAAGESRPEDKPTAADAQGAAAVATAGQPPPEKPGAAEPHLEVLPPKAAKEPGRKIARMLLVGPGPDMCPTLEAAIEAAVPGDVIDIRTNGPLSVPGVTRKFDAKQSLPLTIRGGHGFQPVVKGSVVTLTNLDLVVRRVHFSGTDGRAALTMQSASLTGEDCSFTLSGASLNNEPGGGPAVRAAFRRCLFRTSQVSVAGPNVTVELVDSAFVRSTSSRPTIFVPKLADDADRDEHGALHLFDDRLLSDTRTAQPPRTKTPAQRAGRVPSFSEDFSRIRRGRQPSGAVVGEAMG